MSVCRYPHKEANNQHYSLSISDVVSVANAHLHFDHAGQNRLSPTFLAVDVAPNLGPFRTDLAS